jgi:hypothetical protein
LQLSAAVVKYSKHCQVSKTINFPNSVAMSFNLRGNNNAIGLGKKKEANSQFIFFCIKNRKM